MARTAQIRVRVKPAAREQLEKIAAAHDQTLSEATRDAIGDYLKKHRRKL